jgi:hypothetical protein
MAESVRGKDTEEQRKLNYESELLKVLHRRKLVLEIFFVGHGLRNSWYSADPT